MDRCKAILLFVFSIVFIATPNVSAQSTAFSYQGSLKINGTAANANYDFEFKLFDAPTGGSQLGTTQTISNVTVTDGVFAATLDFGNQFGGGSRYVEIGVRVSGSAGGYQQLLPRQQIATVPYGIRSLTAQNADNAAVAVSATNASTAQNSIQLGGVAANQYVLTTDVRLSDARNPTAGSANYIQNQNAASQPSSNFNISGTGRASIFNASSAFNITAGRILASTGASSSNLFIGVAAGAFNTTGSNNTFSGTSAGRTNTSGIGGSYFGFQSGLNATGSHNSFFGLSSGESTTSGERNSFFGTNSGFSNTSGNDNSVLGFQAGYGNTSGTFNTFIGFAAGSTNTTGTSNTVIGGGANVLQPDLSNATAIGSKAFVSQNNSLVLGSINGIGGAGADTNVGIGTTAPTERLHVVGNGLFTGNLTVNGALAGTFSVPASNISGVLTPLHGGTGLSSSGDAGSFLRSNGSAWVSSPITSADIPSNLNTYIQNQNVGPQTSSNFNISGTGRAAIFDAGTQFNISGTRVLSVPIENVFVGIGAGASSSTGTGNVFAGYLSGLDTTTGGDNSFFGSRAGALNTAGTGNSFFGERAGYGTTGSENSFFGRTAGISNTNGTGNSYFGFSAAFNATGSENSFFGSNSGPHHTTGSKNTYVGAFAGTTNSTGTFNTAIGYNTRFNVDALSYATVIGADATAMRANSITLGRNDGSDDVIVPGDAFVTGTLNANIDAGSITSGTLAIARGGTGLTAPGASGNFLRSDGKTWTSTPLGASDIPSGSPAYIQVKDLLDKPQIANFSIVGRGIAAGLIATEFVEAPEYRINNGRVLSVGDGSNVFAGIGTGTANTTGAGNSFFGRSAGTANTTGGGNSFFGSGAGVSTTSGNGNSLFGDGVGQYNTTGKENSIFGFDAGDHIVTGDNNTLIGSRADVGSGDLNFATAIGSRSFANCSDCVILGAVAGQNQATTTSNVGIGTSNPLARLDVRGNVLFKGNVFVGLDSLPVSVPPNSLAFGTEGPDAPYNHFFIDAVQPTPPLGVPGYTELRITGRSDPGAKQGTMIRFLTAPAGGGAIESMTIRPSGDVQYNFPARFLTLNVGGLPACIDGDNFLSFCASSRRYKTNIATFRSGLDLINRLRPVSFNWKKDGTVDMGLIAEEVAEVEPLLTTTDKNGQTQGVKYDRIGVVLINAVKEQQAEIETLKNEIADLKALLCAKDTKNKICRKK
jgi:hypothetical protein